MFDKIVQRGILMTVIVMIICVLGTLAATKIPVQMIPDLDVRAISIRTHWPGATPQDVEKEILVEQEEYLRNLPNLSRMLSTANSGRAEIELEFPFGTDITEMMIRVSNALSQVQSYPETVDEPQIYANSFSSNSFMFFSITPLPGNPRQLDMNFMQDFIEDNVKPVFTKVTGVSEVGVYGGNEKQLQILVDPAKLAQRQLTLNNVRTAVRERNRDRSGGDVDSGKRKYLLRTIGRYSSVRDLENTILSRRGNSVIRLRDVAEVKLGHFKSNRLGLFNSQPNVFITIRREPGSNVINIKRDVLVQLDYLNNDVLAPEGLQLQLIADDVTYVSQSIDNVWRNLALGALLATAIMFLFLRSLKATLAGVMGIPICIIVSFLGLLLAGRTINVISLAGVAFAIGMTLDNSIVVLESIELERRRGANRLRAAVDGVRKVWPAVFASTMTTVLVFLPVTFIKEEAGQLYSDIAIAISSAILASMLVAVTVLPTAAARLNFAPKEKPGSKGFMHVITCFGLVCKSRILRLVHFILGSQQRQLGTIAMIAVVSVSAIIWLTPAAEYLPEGEEPKVFAYMNAPPGYNLESMQKIALEVNRYFMSAVDADPAAFNQGETPVPPITYVNMMVTTEMIRIISQPLDTANVDALIDALTAKFREYPGMRAFATRGSIISSNDGGSRSINLDISGPDLEALYRVAQEAYLRAGDVFENPRIQTNPGSLTLAQPMVEIHPRWERAAEVGFNADTLGFTVSALTDGSYVDEFFLADNKIDIYLYSTAGQNAKLDNLAQLPVYTPRGAVLPLSDLVDIRETVDTNSVRRVDGNRTVTLNIIPPRTVPLEEGVERVKNQLVKAMQSEGKVPLGVTMTISGAADQLDATRNALTSNYAIALIIIFLLLVAIFNHWGYPLLIMTSIPLGIAGGIVGLWLLNAVGALLPLVGGAPIVQPFDMISMLGFLILMGTVVNNPILIVDRAVFNVDHEGMNSVAAVTEAVESRLRPIAMSTLTTLFGLLPLVVVPGAGTELYRGVGAIVMFGILGAAVVSVTLLPALTVLVLEWKNRIRSWLASRSDKTPTAG